MAATTRRLPAPLYQVKKKLTGQSAPAAPATEADLAAQTDEEREAAWAAYLIPGIQDDVLRNKLGRSWAEPFGCTDKDELTRLEERFTAIRMIELQQRPIEGDFTLRHMKAIHARLFQDVYDWAGEQRNVDMIKEGHDYMAHFQMERLWGKVSDYVERNNRFQDVTDPNEFADKLAFVWGRVNVIHAFREGNTRSQVVFFDQLCSQAGFDLDVSRLAPEHPDSVRDEFVAARFHHQDNDYDPAPLAAVLRKIVRPTPQTLEHRLERAVAEPQPQWAPEARHRADPVATSDYENPDKMRTAHRRPEIQEDTMAIDPSKDPRHPAADRPGSLHKAIQAEQRASREREQNATPRQPNAPLAPRPGSRRSSIPPREPASTAHTIRPMPEGSLEPGQPEPFSEAWWGGPDGTASTVANPQPPSARTPHRISSPEELAAKKLKYRHLFRDDNSQQTGAGQSGPEL